MIDNSKQTKSIVLKINHNLILSNLSYDVKSNRNIKHVIFFKRRQTL
jgi:hypothetical protein